jgi:hypothetical protein
MATDDLLTTRLRHARAFIQAGRTKGRTWAEMPYAYDYETEKPMSLGWFDDNPKKGTAEKIGEAMHAYVQRFKTAPNVVLVNEAEKIEVAGVVVRVESYIRRSNFWVGWEDGYRV